MISFNWTNSSAEDVEIIGGLAFFLVYISECLPYVVLIALGEIVGVIGARPIPLLKFHSPFLLNHSYKDLIEFLYF